MGIEGGTEAVDEGHRAETGRGSGARTVRAQTLLHCVQEHPQHGTLEIGVALQEVAQALGHRQYPLPYRQARDDVISQMRGRRHHAPGVARWADAAPLARERDQEVVSALPAPRPSKAMRKDSAFQVTAELPLHVRRHRPGVVVTVAALGKPGREVLLEVAL